MNFLPSSAYENGSPPSTSSAYENGSSPSTALANGSSPFTASANGSPPSTALVNGNGLPPVASSDEFQFNLVNNTTADQFLVGDIVWAKIGKWPFWPSIICVDTQTKSYTKSELRKWSTGSIQYYHVQFFNDNTRCNWVSKVLKYCGRDEMLQKHRELYSLEMKKMALWNFAVIEAEKWLECERQFRVTLLNSRFFIQISQKEADQVMEKWRKTTTKITKTTINDSYLKNWKKAFIKRALEDSSLTLDEPYNNFVPVPRSLKNNKRKKKTLEL